MIKFIKEQLIIRRLKERLRSYTKPDEAFLKSAKIKFVTLAKERASQGSALPTKAFYSHAWRYATAMAVVVLVMTSTAAVFADFSNVSIDNPLYNLKRVSEKVRVALVPQAQQVELHRVFAHRRLEEASELESKKEIPKVVAEPNIKTELKIQQKPNTVKNVSKEKVRIQKLNKDFEQEVETGIQKAQKFANHSEAKRTLCKDILTTIRERSNINKLSSRIVGRLESNCQEASHSDRDNK